MKQIDLSPVHRFLDRFFASDAVMRPKRDWIILIGLFFIMIVSALAFDASLYQDVASGSMYVSVSASTLHPQTVNSAALAQAMSDFEAKQQAEGAVKLQKLVDPSE